MHTHDERMIRSQILLAPEQRRKLEALAEEEGRSISDVTRRAIDTGSQQWLPKEVVRDGAGLRL